MNQPVEEDVDSPDSRHRMFRTVLGSYGQERFRFIIPSICNDDSKSHFRRLMHSSAKFHTLQNNIKQYQAIMYKVAIPLFKQQNAFKPKNTLTKKHI
jgi:hypothetical protein